jgi:hypothetical protein
MNNRGEQENSQTHRFWELRDETKKEPNTSLDEKKSIRKTKGKRKRPPHLSQDKGGQTKRVGTPAVQLNQANEHD